MYKLDKPILIMGLPNAGKTTLATVLAQELNAVHWNADSVRAHLNKDLSFSIEDRIEQARRMGYLSRTVMASGTLAIADFVCPLEACRIAFGPAYTIFVDRISEGRFADTNALFERPTNADLVIPYGLTVEEQLHLVLGKL